jgi:hypothetical protein
MGARLRWALNGGTAALGGGNHGHDLPKHRVTANALGAHHEAAGATALKKNAAPTPMAISVNMFK